jgi:ectoine hydroxylase-related dioxygenase (phytanoyl-CoA dioxygenase family)
VWPGTHRLYENYFRQHGPEALLEGMPPVQLPEPVMLKGNAGDIVMAHYQLAHTAAQNISPNVRYAIYFRLLHVKHNDQWKEAMTHIWLEWDGMRKYA